MKLNNSPLMKALWLFIGALFLGFMFVPLAKMLMLSFNVADGYPDINSVT